MAISGGDIVDYYMQLERRVARLERTSSVANSQSDTTFVGLLGITGLTVSSQTVVAYGNDFQVYIKFSWNAVSLDSNVQTDDPLKGYLTSWTKDGTNYTGEQFTTTTDATVGALAQGQNITFRVRAVTQKDTYGAYATVNVTSTLDNTAPAQPSTPTAAPYLGQVRVFWNGLNVSAGAMPADLVVCEIHMSTSGITFTPTTATLVDVFYPGGGYYTITDLPYGTTHYFRLVAVDKVGNRSPASTGVSVVPVQAADGDIATLSIGKLIAGTLAADMTVSARIKTANTGARAEMNSAGFHAYNSSNTRTFFVDSSTGDVTVTGLYQTGLSGRRIVIDPAGDETIFFYPTSGSNYSYINAPTAAGGTTTTVGMNSGTWTGYDSTTIKGRVWVNNAGTAVEIIRNATLDTWGGRMNVTDTEALMEWKHNGVNQRSDLSLVQSHARLSNWNSSNQDNWIDINAGGNGIEINTDSNDAKLIIQLGDGTMEAYGRSADMGPLSGYGMFMHTEVGFSSLTNLGQSWGATMVSQVDTVLTVESGTSVPWTMTGSSSTGWSFQTSGASISGQINVIGMRR